jgi:N-acetylneuraminate synthase/N,N'-diacetyllegionaminate synthase
MVNAESKTIEIEGRVIGAGRKTFVIAELGVNHDGSRDRATELVAMAAACGADAVKLQLFRADRLMHPSATFAAYQRDRVNAPDPAEMLRKYELNDDAVADVVRATRRLNLVPLATPFSPEDVDLIDRLDLPAVKIASPDLVNPVLLGRAAQLRRPMLVSTGAATMEEVARTVGWVDAWDVPLALLHCVSSYPAAPTNANLTWIVQLASAFGVPVGYSDHTTVTCAGAVAVAMGATVVEKHLTYDRGAAGPDHSASADPQQFSRYVKLIREAEALRGDPSCGKQVLPAEADVRAVSRQSLVLRRALRRGEVVERGDLTVQRPGAGIPAAMVEQVVGRRTLSAIPAGTMLAWDVLSKTAAKAFHDAA